MTLLEETIKDKDDTPKSINGFTKESVEDLHLEVDKEDKERQTELGMVCPGPSKKQVYV